MSVDMFNDNAQRFTMGRNMNFKKSQPLYPHHGDSSSHTQYSHTETQGLDTSDRMSDYYNNKTKHLTVQKNKRN